jgi:hypothetical protein
MRRVGIWAALACTGLACTENPPNLDPVTGVAAATSIEGQLSLAYSHDMQGETKPCG